MLSSVFLCGLFFFLFQLFTVVNHPPSACHNYVLDFELLKRMLSTSAWKIAILLLLYVHMEFSLLYFIQCYNSFNGREIVNA